MKINTCLTAQSFKNKYWIENFNLLHEDLNLETLPPKNDIPVPFLLRKYWNVLWKKKENIGKEFLNPSNIHIIDIQRIWEFTQIIASINNISKNNLKGKKILSLGAGFEPCLFVFAKLGAEVYASDIYNSSDFWFPEMVKFIKEKPEIFCHYQNFKPNIKYVHLDLQSNKQISRLGKFDIIYSVSSLEHIYTVFRKKRKLFKNITKHLKEGGIFSFTTEFIVKHDNIRRHKILVKKILYKLKEKINSLIKKNYSNILLDKNKQNLIKKINKRNKTQINYITIINLIKIAINEIKNLPRFNIRYDFFTYEELLALIDTLSKYNLYLVEEVDWNSCYELPHESLKPKEQYQVPISLTFFKNLNYKIK